jgi:hypothetical protein
MRIVSLKDGKKAHQASGKEALAFMTFATLKSTFLLLYSGD